MDTLAGTMKKPALIFGIILIVLCGGGFYVFRGYQAKKATAGKQDPNVTQVARGDIVVQVVDSGTVDAVTAVEVKSRVSGRLDHLLVQEGDVVKKGQLLAILDPVELNFRVTQQRAQVSGAKSGLDRATIESGQREKTVLAGYDQAKSRLAQLEKELQAQPTLTSTAIRSAETAWRSAEMALEQLQSTTHPNERVSTQSALDEAKSSLENAKREYERRASLLADGYIPGRDVDDARLQVELAEARMRSAQEKSDRLKQQQRLDIQQAEERVKQTRADYDRARANAIQDDVKREEYKSAQAALRQAEAALRDVQVFRASQSQSKAQLDQVDSSLGESIWQLQNTKVYAPMDGVVTKKLAQEGELVTGLSSFSAGTGIVRLEDRRHMMVRLSLNEIDTAKISNGMKTKITLDALPNKSFVGTVKKIAPASIGLQTSTVAAQTAQTDAVVKYQVEIWLDDTDPAIRSGMTAKCTLDVIRQEKVLMLPVAFIGKDKDGEFVNTAPAKPGDQPGRIKITVGASSGAFTEIKSGVTEGQKIIKPKFTGPSRKGMMQAGGPD